MHELEQRPAEALRAYEAILVRQKDPEVYRRASTLARKLGDTRRADELFAAAEAGAERILAAGEIYALETQARLYADAGVKLERAEELAQKNRQHERPQRLRHAVIRAPPAHGFALRVYIGFADAIQTILDAFVEPLGQ